MIVLLGKLYAEITSTCNYTVVTSYVLLLPTLYIYTLPLCFCRQSATCTHVSALLHALVAMTPVQFSVPSSEATTLAEETLPVTSYPCQWKPPCKRKESNWKIADVHVEKHTYGKQRKVELLPMEQFDPRPSKYRGTTSARLTEFLGKVCREGLGVSFLFDPSTQYWVDGEQCTLESTESPSLPSHPDLQYTVTEF